MNMEEGERGGWLPSAASHNTAFRGTGPWYGQCPTQERERVPALAKDDGLSSKEATVPSGSWAQPKITVLKRGPQVEAPPCFLGQHWLHRGGSIYHAHGGIAPLVSHRCRSASSHANNSIHTSPTTHAQAQCAAARLSLFCERETARRQPLFIRCLCEPPGSWVWSGGESPTPPMWVVARSGGCAPHSCKIFFANREASEEALGRCAAWFAAPARSGGKQAQTSKLRGCCSVDPNTQANTEPANERTDELAIYPHSGRTEFAPR